MARDETSVAVWGARLWAEEAEVKAVGRVCEGSGQGSCSGSCWEKAMGRW